MFVSCTDTPYPDGRDPKGDTTMKARAIQLVKQQVVDLLATTSDEPPEFQAIIRGIQNSLGNHKNTPLNVNENSSPDSDAESGISDSELSSPGSTVETSESSLRAVPACHWTSPDARGPQ